MQIKVTGRAAAKEQELISWDEAKDQKEVYRAVRTPDGRQALVKAGGMHLSAVQQTETNPRLLCCAAEPYIRRAGHRKDLIIDA